MDENIVKIIVAIVSLLIVIVSGSWISKKISKNKRTDTEQSNIHISGDNSKVVGRDDNSKN